jgi:hypothetical protein
MEWDEFSNHIIELGLVKKDTKGQSSDIIKEYFPNNQKTDLNLKRDAEIERLFFIAELNYIIALEKDCSKIRVFSATDC